MEKVASKIEAIAEQVSQIFYKNPNVEFVRRSEEKDWGFRLYRYYHDQDNTKEQNHSRSRNEIDCVDDRECDDHGLCIHLPLEHFQFYIQSERGPLTFDAGPEMLVVTIGKQIEVTNGVAPALLRVSIIYAQNYLAYFLFILELCRDLNVFQGK